ncbi:MAG: DUF6427 family protein [Runella sp.]
MLSFFKINGLFQILSCIMVLVLLQLPYYLSPPPLLISELEAMLIGEKMGQGFMLYREVWDNVSPLSAVVYWCLDELFGRSLVAHRTLANLLILFQALYFNYISIQRQLFTERNYLPGILYLLFINLSYDCSTLSPALMATTFLLLAFGTLIRQMQREGVTDEVFEMGFYLSLASLFYLPMSLFFVWALVSLLLYTGANLRQYALAVFGYLFPIGLTFLLFFFQDSLDDLKRNLLQFSFATHRYSLTDFRGILFSMSAMVILGVLGFFQTLGYARFVNYQARCQQIMVVWFITAALAIVLVSYLAPMQMIAFIAPSAFFAVNFFLLMRRRWLTEAVFLVLFIGVFLLRYDIIFPKSSVRQLQHLQVKEALLPAAIRHQKILVIGKNEGEYYSNQPTTAYLNWELARYDFENLDSYESVISIFDNFTSDPPTYVIDKENLMPKVFARLPELSARYQPTQWKGIYKSK